MISTEEFKELVRVFAEEVGVNFKEIQVRKMKKKWGSCSTKGRLTFDDALLKKEKEFTYEKVLHELLHLKYPNHGKMFKTILKAYLDQMLREY